MSETTYGLRHVPTGKFVRMSIRENSDGDTCGAETVELELHFGHFDMPRFEEDLNTAMWVLSGKEEVRWYNSSRDRPMRGQVDLSACEIVSFTRELRYDIEGGDPVFTSETVRPALLPVLHPVRLNEARLTGKAVDLMPDAFGDEWSALLEASSEHGVDMYFDLMMLVAREEDGIPGRGAIVETEVGNRAQVALVADFPAHWPLGRSTGTDTKEGLKLLACRWNKFFSADHPLASPEGSDSPKLSR